MTVELANDKQHQSSLTERVRTTNHRMLLPEPATHKIRQAVSGREWGRAHVFHGSREAKVSISIHYIYCLERTRLRFPCDEHDMQCYGSWTDLVGKAIYGDLVVIDSL